MSINWLTANHCASERVLTPPDPQSPRSACPALGGAAAPGFGQMFLLFFSRSCHNPWNSPIPFMTLKTERPRRPIRLRAASELQSPAHRPLLGHLIKCRGKFVWAQGVTVIFRRGRLTSPVPPQLGVQRIPESWDRDALLIRHRLKFLHPQSRRPFNV